MAYSWIIVMFLSAVWTLKSVLMKKQTHLHLGWPEGEWIFFFFFFDKLFFLTILKLNPQHITFSAQDTRISSSIGQAVLENAWMEIKFHITHNIFGWTIPVTFFFFVHSCWSFLKKCTKSQHRFFNRIRSSICLFLVITKAVTFLISWDSN